MMVRSIAAPPNHKGVPILLTHPHFAFQFITSLSSASIFGSMRLPQMKPQLLNYQLATGRYCISLE